MIKDYLGSNRLTFYRNPITQNVETLESTDYYPFGMATVDPSSKQNKYLYNGKENQQELEEYDYGARFYDPAIVRWSAVDPLAEMYDPISGYVYVANNPTNFTDPTGMKIKQGSTDAWVESWNYWSVRKAQADDAIRSTQSTASSERWSQQRLNQAMSPLTLMSSTAAGNLEKLMSVANASEYYKTTSPGHWEVVVEEKKADNQGGR